MFAPGIYTADSTPWRKLLSAMMSFFQRNISRSDDDLAKDPERLAELVRPVCESLIREMDYPGCPQPKEESIDALLELMYKRAAQLEIPLDNPRSAHAFRLGFTLGLAR